MLSLGFDLQAPFPDHLGVGQLHEVGQCDSIAQTEHDATKQAIKSVDTHGEGNYVSTRSSENRDQKTDHGLTIPPKIQSSEPWRLRTVFSTKEPEVLIGRMQNTLGLSGAADAEAKTHPRITSLLV